ncbi:MAG TPA: hypothetical protein VIK89_12175 [Cytophagaceae bacterium]
MTVKKFVFEINYFFPTSDQIVYKYGKVIQGFDLAKAEVYRQNNLLKLNIDQFEEVALIDQLILCTNISSISIGSINFSSEVTKVNGTFKEFAYYNDFYHFCYDIFSMEIVSFDNYFDNKEVVATSPEQFLKFLVEYNKHYRGMIFEMSYSKLQSLEILNKLIEEGFSKRWINELMPGWSQL